MPKRLEQLLYEFERADGGAYCAHDGKRMEFYENIPGLEDNHHLSWQKCLLCGTVFWSYLCGGCDDDNHWMAMMANGELEEQDIWPDCGE